MRRTAGTVMFDVQFIADQLERYADIPEGYALDIHDVSVKCASGGLQVVYNIVAKEDLAWMPEK